MFSKALVNFTGIFLTLRLYISATSATPIEQPGEAQNITDDIHARAYNAYQCEYPYTWMRRECMPWALTVWQDVCGLAAYTPDFRSSQIVYDNKPGQCDPGFRCFNGFNGNGDRFIYCLPAHLSKGKTKVDPQAGTSDPERARLEVGNTQFEYSVTLDHDMTGAAVTADIESEDGSFLIAPNNVIVGNVHGRREEVCHGNKIDPASARNCYPKGTYDFTAGQTIDFTWGLSSNQVGKLAYSIIPAL